MGLNTRSIFDPRWQQALGRVSNGAMTSSVLIRRPRTTNGPITPHPGEWDYELGGWGLNTFDDDYLPIWTGPARVQPDKDWRARGYSFGDDSTVFQAVRIVTPLDGGTWNEDLEPYDKELRDQDEVLIVANYFKSLEPILKYVFVVRNPLGSGVAPAHNLLCDVNLKGGLDRGK